MIESIRLKNLTTLEELAINMDQGPYYLESVDVGGISGLHQSYKFPGQVGETVDSSTLGTRSISITGWCVNTKQNSLSSLKSMLNSFINPQQGLRMYYSDYYIDFLPDATIQYSKNRKDNNSAICKFLISGEAYSPLWSTAEAKESPVSYSQGGFILPFSVNEENPIVFGMIYPVFSTSIYNPGLPIGCKITITARGLVTNPRVTCPETQETFSIDKTLQPGEEIVISTLLGDRYVHGYLNGEFSNYLQYIGENSSWITIPKETSTISFSAELGAEFLLVSVAFNPSFLEVEE